MKQEIMKHEAKKHEAKKHEAKKHEAKKQEAMKHESLTAAPATGPAVSPSPAHRVRYAGPIWTLIFLAPMIAEVLSGSTRMSFIFVLAPEMMVWGCGALLCRELVRRWRGGATSLLLLGLALSVAEEFVIQQTSLAPLPFPGANAHYARAFGVSWLYFLFMLGYESVWVTLVPVAITELIFSDRRRQPWLRKGGAIAVCAVFVLGCYIAWFSWTKGALPRMHVSPYHPPLLTIGAGVAAILLLGCAAYALRGVGREDANGSRRVIGSSWIESLLAGIVAFVLGGAWFKLIGMLFTPVECPAWIPLAAGCAGGVFAYILFATWSSRRSWGDWQRYAAAFGATMACMSVDYINTAGWTRSDLIGKAILNVLALLGLIWLGVKMRGRSGRNAREPELRELGS
jgi:hypothetical protein